ACPFSFFFFTASLSTAISPLSLHDALPISVGDARVSRVRHAAWRPPLRRPADGSIGGRRRKTGRDPRRLPRATREGGCIARGSRSEEHTSELQSPCNLVCRLLLEKKKKKKT